MKEKKSHATAIAIPALLLLLFSVAAAFTYMDYSAKNIRNNAFDTLNSSASNGISVLQTRFEGAFDILRTFSAGVNTETREGKDALTRRMTAIVDNSLFLRMGITESTGRALTCDGAVTDISKRSFFASAMSGTSTIHRITDSPVDPGDSYYVLSVPVYSGDTVVGVVFGSLDNVVLSQLLVSEAFQRESVCFMTDGDGNVIMSPQENRLLREYSNIFSITDLVVNDTSDTLRRDMMTGRSGYFILELSDTTSYYITYQRFSDSGEYMFCSVNGDVVQRQIDSSVISALLLSGGLLTVFALFSVYILVTDSRRRKRIEQERDLVRQSEERSKFVLDFSEGAIFEADLRNDTMWFTGAYERIFGRKPMLARVTDMLLPHPYIYEEDKAIFRRMGVDINKGIPHGISEYRVVVAGGNLSWHRVEFKTIFDSSGNPQRVIGVIEDINDLKTAMVRLQIKAESDSLTGLCNNAAFRAKVEDYLDGDGHGGLHAFIIFDIDNFKNINNTLGHPEGDRILQMVGRRLPELFRTTDIVARIGGDEFAVFLKDVGVNALVLQKAQEICEFMRSLSAHFGGFAVSSSVGISLYSRDGTNFDSLYRKADTALYYSKDNGKDRYTEYTDSMGEITT